MLPAILPAATRLSLRIGAAHLIVKNRKNERFLPFEIFR
jgi:hypothetical protein